MKILTMTIVSPDKVVNNKEFEHAEDVMEFAARTCYDSTDAFKLNPNFIKGIMKAKHWDILEHGYLAAEIKLAKVNYTDELECIIDLMGKHPFMNVIHYKGSVAISGNLRTWYEFMNNVEYWYGFVQQRELCELLYVLQQLAPTVFRDIVVSGDTDLKDIKQHYNERQYELMMVWLQSNLDIRTTDYGGTVELIACAPKQYIWGNYTFFVQHVSRALMAQITRHRLMTFSVRSFRYTEAEDLKYVHDIAEEQNVHDEIEECYQHVVKTYANLRKQGVKRQVARGVLPTNIETEMVISGPVRGWTHLFNERTASDAQGEIRQLAINMKELYEMV
jgi:thymidylate synthase ThyX